MCFLRLDGGNNHWAMSALSSSLTIGLTTDLFWSEQLKPVKNQEVRKKFTWEVIILEEKRKTFKNFHKKDTRLQQLLLIREQLKMCEQIFTNQNNSNSLNC